MMIKGKGNALAFGKIQLGSESEDMEKLVVLLKTIIKDLGYPKDTVSSDFGSGVDQDEVNKLKEAMKAASESGKSGGKDGIQEPAERRSGVRKEPESL